MYNIMGKYAENFKKKEYDKEYKVEVEDNE